jgi:hypothetical protein
MFDISAMKRISTAGMKFQVSLRGLPMFPSKIFVKNFGAMNQGASATRAKSTLPMNIATIVAAITPQRIQPYLPTPLGMKKDTSTGTATAIIARMNAPLSMITPSGPIGKMRSMHAALVRLTPITTNRGPITTGVARKGRSCPMRPFLNGMTRRMVIALTMTSPHQTGTGPSAKIAEIIAAMNTICCACATGNFNIRA